MNIGHWVRKWSLLAPTKTAIIEKGYALTYGELNQRCNKLTNFLLDRGVARGDRVGLVSHNCHEYLEIYLALSKLGAILVPLNWRMAPPEIVYILKDSGTTHLLFGQDYLDLASHIRESCELIEDYIVLGEEDISWARRYDEMETYPDEEPSKIKMPEMEDPHLIMYTSGTTGSPKGVVLSNRKTFYNALNANIYYGLTSDDILLVHRPLFHSGGLLVNVTPAFYKGASVIIRKRFSPQDCLEAIQRHKATIFEASATLLNFILRDCNLGGYDLSSLKACYTGGERVSTPMLKEYSKRGITIGQLFGMTETSTLCWLPKEVAMKRVGSVGKPVFHGELRIINEKDEPVKPGEVGEIVVEGPILMSGYWNKPDLSCQVMKNGWFYSGDLATTDDEGYIYIMDRKQDMYISGGENISPAEIEKHLLTHPKIFDVTVYGVPDEKWGEVGKASIIVKERETLTEHDVVEFLEGKIGRYKIPKYFEFIDDFPRTASGKVQKYKMVQRHLRSLSHSRNETAAK